MNSIIRKQLGYLGKYIQPKRLEGKDAQNVIKELLLGDSPCMIARFGSVEIQATLFPYLPLPVKYLLKANLFRSLINNAGFFPVNKKM